MENHPKILTICLMAMMVACVAAFVCHDGSSADAVPGEHANHDDFTEWTNTTALPTEAGSYYLANNVTPSANSLVLHGDVVLCLNGHDITMYNTGSLSVSGSGTLTICDCDTSKHRYGYYDANNNYGIFDVAPEEGKAYVDLIGGIIKPNSGGQYCTVVTKSDLTLTGGNIVGGVMVNADANSVSFTMYGGTVSGTDATTINKGGVLLWSTVNTDYKADFTMNGGTVALNKSSAQPWCGVGVYNSNKTGTSTITINGGEIRDNTLEANNSGGAAIRATNGATLNINGGIISGNYCSFNGGGIYVSSDISMTITGGTITGNTAGRMGGGIISYSTKGCPISGVTVSNNTAGGNGGGIYQSGGTLTPLTISDSVISGNTSGDCGGGIYNSSNDLTVTGCTISNNSAKTASDTYTSTGLGGGIYATTNVTTDSEFSGNQAKNAAAICVNYSGKRVTLSSGAYIHDNVASGADFTDSTISGAIRSTSVIYASGYVRVTDNTCGGLENNILVTNYINITGALKVGEDKSVIGIHWNTGGSSLATNGWGQYNAGEDATDYFVTDRDNQTIVTVVKNTYQEVAFTEDLTLTLGDPSGGLTYGNTSSRVYSTQEIPGGGVTLEQFNQYTTFYLMDSGSPVEVTDQIYLAFENNSGIKLAIKCNADTAAGTHTIKAVLDRPAILNGSSLYRGIHAESNTIEVEVAKIAGSYTAPAAVAGLAYDGDPHPLVTAATDVVGGTVKYSLDNENWSESVPSAILPGGYTVYHKLFGDENHNDSNTGSVACSIAKATVQWPDPTVATYDGSEQTSTIAATAGYTVAAQATGTNAGSYNGTLALTDTDLYMWTDSEAAERSGVLLTIGKATDSGAIPYERGVLTTTPYYSELRVVPSDIFGDDVPPGARMTGITWVSGDNLFSVEIEANILYCSLMNPVVLDDVGLTDTFVMTVESDNVIYTNIRITFVTVRTAYFTPAVTDNMGSSFYAIDDPALANLMEYNNYLSAGAVFSGWYTHPVFGDLLPDVGQADPNTDYYARWTIDGKQIITDSLDLNAYETLAIGGIDWDRNAETLTLDGLWMPDLFCTKSASLIIPGGTTVTLTDGTDNIIQSQRDACIFADGNVTITGGGSLMLGESKLLATAIMLRSNNGTLTLDCELSITGENGIAASPGVQGSRVVVSGSVEMLLQESDVIDQTLWGFQDIHELSILEGASVTINNAPYSQLRTVAVDADELTVSGDLRATRAANSYGMVGIQATNVTIEHSGTVVIERCDNAVIADADIYVAGALLVNEGYGDGISFTGGTFEVDGGMVEIETSDFSANGLNVVISYGYVSMNTGYGNTLMAKDVVISGGDVYIQNSCDDEQLEPCAVRTVYGNNEGSFRMTDGYVEIDSIWWGLRGDTVTIGGGTFCSYGLCGVQTAEFLMTGGDAYIDGNPTSISAPSVTIQGGKLEMCAVVCTASQHVTVSGGYVLMYGYYDGQDITTAPLQIYGADGTLALSDGTLDITSETRYGIKSEGTVTVTGGVLRSSLTGDDAERRAIYSDDEITIGGASITVTGGPIESGTSLTVGTGDVYAQYENAAYFPNGVKTELTHDLHEHAIPGNMIAANGDGEYRIFFHTHSWTFESPETDTIVATCSNEDGCPEHNTATITIIAPEGDLIADGMHFFPASLSRPSVDGVPEYSIGYGYKITQAATYQPTDNLSLAGYYQAFVTIGGVSAYVEYIVLHQTEVEIVTGGGVYTGNPHPAEATVTDPMVGADGTMTYMYRGVDNDYSSAEAPTDAGTYIVTVVPPDWSIYSLVGVYETEFTITPKGVTISGAGALNKEYDGTTEGTVSGNMSVVGKIGDDEVAVVPGTATFANANAGEGIAVTFSGFTLGGTDAGNYRLLNQPAAAAAAITPKPVTVTGIGAGDKTYDGTTSAAPTGTGELVGILPADVDYVGLVTGTGTFDSKDVGEGITVTFSGFTLDGARHSNYALAQPADVTADITAADITVGDVEIADKQYDGTTAATITGTSVLVGVFGGDDVELVSSGASAVFSSANVANNIPVSVSGFTITGEDAGNYVLNMPIGILGNITKRQLTITGATAEDKTYDGNTDAVIDSEGTLVGIIGDEDVAIVPGTAAFNDKDAADNKTVVFSGFAIGGEDVGNYVLASQPANTTASITKKTLTISGLSVQDKVYDNNQNATITGDAVINDLVGAETVILNDGTASFADKNVGTDKTVTFSGYTIGGQQAANYVLEQPASVTADITPLPVSVAGNVNIVSKHYDGNTTATWVGNLTLSQKFGSDDVELVQGTADFDTKTAGTGKTVTFSGFYLTGEDAPNYALSQHTPLTGEILAMFVSISGVGSADKEYDGDTDAALTGTPVLSETVEGDDVSIDTGSAYALFSDKTVGTDKTVTFYGYALTGEDAGNYYLEWQPAPVTADITAATLTVTGVVAVDKTYDGTTDAFLDGSVRGLSGVVQGDDVSLVTTGATASFADKNVGTKTVTFGGYAISGDDAGNYVLLQPESQMASITAKAVTITGVTAENKTYEGGTYAAITGTPGLSGVVGEDDVTVDTTNARAAFADKNVGTGKTVTFSGFAIAGEDAANYVLSAQPGSVTADITARDVTVLGIHAEDKTYDKTTTGTIGGTPQLSNFVIEDNVSLVTTGATAIFASAGVGTDIAVTIGGYAVSGADAGNYNMVQPSGQKADITPKPVTITGVVAVDKTYDGTTDAFLDGSVRGLSGVVQGDDVSLVTTGATASFADKNAGTDKTVTFGGYAISGDDAGNYVLLQPESQMASITAKAVTITGVTAENKTYDGTASARITGTPALSGVIGEDEVTVDATNASASFADKNVGTGKTVTFSGFAIAGEDAANYVLSAQPGSVTADITVRNVSVAGITADDKVYDKGTNGTIGGTAQLINAVTGDDVTLVTTGATATFASANVATDIDVTIAGYAISGTDASNYLLIQPDTQKADITPKPVTITGVTAENKVYDGDTGATPVTDSAQVSGVEEGDTVTVDATNASAAFRDPNVGTDKPVDFSGFAISGADAANYALSAQPDSATATIGPKELTITGISVDDKVYDGTTAGTISGTAQLINTVEGDDITLVTTGATASFADKNVGTDIDVTIAGYAISGTDAPNYYLTQPGPVTADITPLTLVVDYSFRDKVYDGTTTAQFDKSPELPEVIKGDSVWLISAIVPSFSDKNVGTDKPVNSRMELGGADKDNYALSLPDTLTADITPKPVTITGVTAADKVYDGNTTATPLTALAAVSGVIEGDTVTFTAGAAAFRDPNVGTDKPVDFSGFGITGADAANYVLSEQPASATANITAAELTVTGATVADKVYDGSTSGTISGTPVLNGLIGDDSVTLSEGTAEFSDKNVGAGKTVTLTFAISGTDAPNYYLTQPDPVTADITVRNVSVAGITADDKQYDKTTAGTISGTAQLINTVEGDDITLVTTGATATFASANVATDIDVTIAGYAISGTDASNYLLIQPDTQKAAITPRQVTITGVTAANKVYDGNTAATPDTSSAQVTNVLDGDTVHFTPGSAVFKDANIGTGKTIEFSGFSLIGAHIANYVLSAQPDPVTADITPKELTVTGITISNKEYDGTTAATISGTPAVNGLVGTETVTLSAGTAVFSDKNVGTNKTVTVSYEISGPAAANYALTQPGPMTATIIARLIVLDYTADDKQYDSTTAATLSPAVPSPSGIVDGDQVMITAPYDPVFYDENVGIDKPVFFPGYSLSGGDAGNYTLSQPENLTATISPRALAVTGITADDKVYDGTLAAGYSGTPALAGLMGTDTVTLDSLTLKFLDKDVAAGKTVAVDSYVLSGADAGNYYVVESLTITASISPATLTAAYVSETVPCVNGSPAYAVSVTGFADGESESLPGFVRPTVQPVVLDIGTWNLTPSGGEATNNYMFSYAEGVLTVAHPHMQDSTVGSLTVHTCDTCHRTFIDPLGRFEYVATGDDSAAIGMTDDGNGISDADALQAVDYAKEAKAAVPGTEIETMFSAPGSDSISVSADAVKQSGQAGIPVVLKTKGINIEAPADLLKDVGGAGKLTASGSVTTDVREDMKKYIDKDTVVVDVTLTLNGQAWTQFGENKIKVTLPYELKEGQTADSIRVVCLSGDEPEYFDATYDAASKTVSFYTSHCSQFAVVPDEEGGPGSGGISIALIAGIAVAIAAAAGIAVYFLFLRKKTA